MERIPEDRPVLLVGNHSGGNLTPDTLVFTLAFYTYFGVERPLLPARPQPRARLARSARCCAATGPSPPRTRTRARRSTPGRPCWSIPAATGRSTGRPGSRARSTSRGAGASSAWRSRPAFRSFRSSRSAARRPRSSSATASGSRKRCASTSSSASRSCRSPSPLPWIVNVGDFLGHLPLPAKITIQVLEPIDLSERFGKDPDRRRGLRRRHRRDAGRRSTSSPAERRLPVIG